MVERQLISSHHVSQVRKFTCKKSIYPFTIFGITETSSSEGQEVYNKTFSNTLLVNISAYKTYYYVFLQDNMQSVTSGG